MSGLGRMAPAHPTRGYFAVGIVNGKTPQNIGTLLRSASTFGAAFVFTVGARYQRQASDTAATPLHTPLFHYPDLDDLVGHLPHACPLIGVEQGGRPLGGFGHPVRAAYLLGAEDHGLPQKALDACHAVVEIESLHPRSLNVAAAGTVLLHHRHLQAGRAAAMPA